MTSEEPDDIQAAHAWLAEADTPKLLVDNWCPNSRNRCRLGEVYSTPWGYLYLGRAWKQRSDPGHLPGAHVGMMTLLTNPDGSRRSFGFMHRVGTGCQHGTLVEVGIPFDTEEMFRLLGEGQHWKGPAPASCLACWTG